MYCVANLLPLWSSIAAALNTYKIKFKWHHSFRPFFANNDKYEFSQKQKKKVALTSKYIESIE